jgi:uncharacterized phage protein (TIGR02218 family)
VTKVVPAGLLSNYQSDSPTVAWAIKITRTDDEVYGWTSADRDATIDAVIYESAPGLSVASFASSAGLAVDNSELTVLADDTIITRADILAGRWNNAAYLLFKYDWTDVSAGEEVISAGFLGELHPRSGAYVAELRALQQYLQQPVGAASTKTCRARLGDAMCMVDLGGWTETGTITSVTSKQVFTDSSRTEADDYFGEGILTWTAGLNTGLSQKVKTYASDTFTLSLPMIFDVQIGDTYSVIAGCRKRLDEDCAAKFSNELNFQGEPHRPTVDELTSSPEVNV